VRRRRGVALALLFAIGAAALPGCSSQSRPSTGHRVCNGQPAAVDVNAPQNATSPAAAPVAGGFYFGGFALHGAATQDNFVDSFDELATTACRTLNLAHVYLRWRYPFPTPAAETFAKQGDAVIVSWTGTDTIEMGSGSVDDTIRKTAREVAALDAPVFFEFRWEMDRPNLAGIVHGPTDYVAAWDRVRRIFAEVGTPNVSWVWCPTSAGFTSGRAQHFYPGDDQVDWICTDAYPDPYRPPAYQPLRHLLRPFLDWTRSHDKPLMVGEFGVPHSYSPAQRATWLKDARATFTQGRRIRAVAYFDADPPGNPPSMSYSLGSDPSVTAAMRDLAADPYFRPPGNS